MNKYFCILGGGGIRGASYTGAIKALKEAHLEITGWAGSSIGAVVAGLVTFGYTPDEIQDIFDNINFEFFKDINFNFGKDFALSKGGNFYEWMKNKIEEKYYGKCPANAPVCFKDAKNELVIFSVDLASSKFFEFSKTKTPDVEIAHAIRVSVGMPGLYSPVFNKDECLVDGDLLKSTPLWKVSETIQKREEKILEFRLEANREKKNITNTFEYLNAVYDSTSGFASDFIIETYKNHENYDYIKINLDGISVVDFMINKEKKHEMAKKGYEAAINYFKYERKEKTKKITAIYRKIYDSLKKINFFINNKDFEETGYEFANIFSEIIPNVKNLDEKTVKDILAFKELFDSGYVLKKGFFGKKHYVLMDSEDILSELKSITEKISNKLNV